jgi:uncharacterized protein (TIGR03546 family)
LHNPIKIVRYPFTAWEGINMLEMIAKTLKVLNSETDPGQISLACCLAMIMAFTPLLLPHNLLVLLAALVLRVNLSAFGISFVLLSALSFALDPLFHRLGLAILTAGGLQSMWTGLYNTYWFRLDQLNNSIVMGSLALALVLFGPTYLILNSLIKRYREHVLSWIQKTPLMTAIRASKLYSIYQTISGLRGAA